MEYVDALLDLCTLDFALVIALVDLSIYRMNVEHAKILVKLVHLKLQTVIHVYKGLSTTL